jgi:hypothetical protein
MGSRSSQGEVVRYRGPADGAEVHLIASRKGIEAVFGHHATVLQIQVL